MQIRIIINVLCIWSDILIFQSENALFLYVALYSVSYNMCYLETMNTYQQNKNENLDCKPFTSYTSRSRQTKKRGLNRLRELVNESKRR